MTLADTNLAFNSNWDIDQILPDFPQTTSVNASTDTLIYTFANAAEPPVYEVQFKPATQNMWYQSGTNSTNNTTASAFGFQVWVNGTGVYIRSDIAGTSRIYAWSDTFNV